MISMIKINKFLSLAAVLLVAVAASANSVPLVPNAAPIAPGSFSLAGYTLVTSVPFAFNAANAGNLPLQTPPIGVMTESVYRNNTNHTLTFAFQFTTLTQDALHDFTLSTLPLGLTYAVSFSSAQPGCPGPCETVNLITDFDANNNPDGYLFQVTLNKLLGINKKKNESGLRTDIIFLQTNATQYNFGGALSYGDSKDRLRGDIEGIAIPTAVPEPASFMMFGSGLLGLAGFARRRFTK